AGRRSRTRRARRPPAGPRAPRAGASGCTSPRGGCRRFPGASSCLGLLDGRDGRSDLDAGRAPLEGAARVDEQALVAGLALAVAANAALELDLERRGLDDQVAAREEALGVERLDRCGLEPDLGSLCGIEEVRRGQVRVALVVVGPQAFDADRARERRLLATLDPAVELREAAVDRADEVRRVGHLEPDRRVNRID